MCRITMAKIQFWSLEKGKENGWARVQGMKDWKVLKVNAYFIKLLQADKEYLVTLKDSMK